jgi:hypothetical protein
MAVPKTPFRKQRKAPHMRNERPCGGGEGGCHRGMRSETMGDLVSVAGGAATCESGVAGLFEGI